MTYALLASGDEKKIEQFGPYIIERPCSAALWKLPKHPQVDASFSREKEKGWEYAKKLPSDWTVDFNGVLLKLKPTSFGHLGVFPEHATQWPFLKKHAKKRVLSLFAYSGATTMFLAKQGIEVCHVDASKGMIDWAKENAHINGLDDAPIRWIVDDVMKFLLREAKRGSVYDGVLFDPPSFGRGSKGQVFKIERDIHKLLGAIRNVLSKDASFVLFTCHTPGITPLTIENLLRDAFGEKGTVDSGELVLDGALRKLPAGTFGRWFQ